MDAILLTKDTEELLETGTFDLITVRVPDSGLYKSILADILDLVTLETEFHGRGTLEARDSKER